jgi:hypothetical protein
MKMGGGGGGEESSAPIRPAILLGQERLILRIDHKAIMQEGK